MAMGACPGQIPMPCVPPALMVTATMVRACRYNKDVSMIGDTKLHSSSDTFIVRSKMNPMSGRN